MNWRAPPTTRRRSERSGTVRRGRWGSIRGSATTRAFLTRPWRERPGTCSMRCSCASSWRPCPTLSAAKQAPSASDLTMRARDVDRQSGPHRPSWNSAGGRSLDVDEQVDLDDGLHRPGDIVHLLERAGVDLAVVGAKRPDELAANVIHGLMGARAPSPRQDRRRRARLRDAGGQAGPKHRAVDRAVGRSAAATGAAGNRAAVALLHS
jgi:hypothetical protein